jgi:hypothetical protein
MNETQFLKKLNETYLFNVTDNYRIMMTKAVVESDRLNIRDDKFEDIRASVSRRQVNSVISRTMKSPDVVFIKPSIPLPRALKVFTVKDIKTPGNPLKVFIDISEIIYEKDGEFKIASVDKLIAYLTSAMMQLIYNSEPNRLISNTTLIAPLRSGFAQLVSYIIDYLYKTSNLDGMRDMIKHMASMYFDINILKRDYNISKDSIDAAALKISGLSNRQLDVLEIYTEDDTFDNIKTFVETLNELLKVQKLTIDVFMKKWLDLCGSGTQFALEYFPSLSDMFTNAYCLSYINNQKTIEKIVGKDLSLYSSKLIALGGGLI